MRDEDDEVVEGEPRVTKEDIEKRVENWHMRLINLFESLEVWAKHTDWSVVHPGDVPMHEELMRKYDVPMRELPTLRLQNVNGKFIFFKPKALWVIGANGRIDVFTRQSIYTMIDQAASFEEPDWMLFGSNRRGKGLKFTPDVLVGVA